MDDEVNLRILFDSIDADNDGVLSREDLIKSLPNEFDEEQIDTIIRKLDVNHNHHLTFEEFARGVSFFLDPDFVDTTRSTSASISLFEISRNQPEMSLDDIDFDDTTTNNNNEAYVVDDDNFSDNEEISINNQRNYRPSIGVSRGREISSIDNDSHYNTMTETSVIDAVATYKEKVSRLKQKCLHLQERVKTMSEAGIGMETENLNLRKELEMAKSDLRYARQEIRDEKNNVVAYQKMIKKMQLSEMNLKLKMNELEDHKKSVAQRLKDTEERHSSLIEEAELLRNRMEKEREEKSREIERRNSVVEEVTAKIKKTSQEQIEYLRKELDNALEANEMLQKNLAHSQDEVESLQNKLSAAKIIQQQHSTTTINESQNHNIVPSQSLAEDLENEYYEDETVEEVVIIDDENSDMDDNVIVENNKSIKSKTVQWNDSGDIRSRAITTPLISQQNNEHILAQKNFKIQASKLLEQIELHKDRQLQLRDEIKSSEVDDLKYLLKESKKRVLELETRIEHLENELERYRNAENIRNENNIVTDKQGNHEEIKLNLATSIAEELNAFARYFNFVFKNHDQNNSSLPNYPLNENNGRLILQIKDGWILAYFLNIICPNTVDIRALNIISEQPLTEQEMVENLTLVLDACRSIGIRLNNLNPSDILVGHKKPLIITNFLSSLILLHLLAQMNVRVHPELVRIVDSGQVEDLLKLNSSERLKLWMNYHVKKMIKSAQVKELLEKCNIRGVLNCENWEDIGVQRKIFGLVLLLHSLFSDIVTLEKIEKSYHENTLCEFVIDMIEQQGLSKLIIFTSPAILNEGGFAAKNLNLLFIASIFQLKCGIDVLNNEEKIQTTELLETSGLIDNDDKSSSREERMFRNWINSMNVKTGQFWDDAVYLTNLYADCRDGIALLRILEHIKPGIVNWRRVEKNPKNNKFKMVSNCNLIIDCCKHMKFLSVHNIGGSDIMEGNKKLILALVWQLMHHYISSFLTNLYQKKFGVQTRYRRASVSGSSNNLASRNQIETNDDLILKWANERVSKLSDEHQTLIQELNLLDTPYGYPYEKMLSFNDSHLSNSLFFLHLIWSLAPHIVNWELVTKGDSFKAKFQNALYAISLVRKLGGTVFLLPDDLVDCNVKMIIVFIASILSIDDKTN